MTTRDTPQLTKSEIEALIERAAAEGARQALREVGLHDDAAAGDVRDLRSLLDAWRDARRTAWRAAVKTATTVVLTALAGMAGYHMLSR
jgi:hypothetical protein